MKNKVLYSISALFFSMCAAGVQAAGECGKYRSEISVAIGEGTKDYNWIDHGRQRKYSASFKTQLEDTITLGKFNANGYLACQAVYTVTNTVTGDSRKVNSSKFAVVTTDSGKASRLVFAENPADNFSAGNYKIFTENFRNEIVRTMLMNTGGTSCSPFCG